MASVDFVPRDKRSIAVQNLIRVNLSMEMDRASNVESRENSLHFHHPVSISWLHSMQETSVVSVQVSDTDFEVRDVEVLQKCRKGDVWAQPSEA